MVLEINEIQYILLSSSKSLFLIVLSDTCTYLVYLRLILIKSVSIFDYTAANGKITLKNELERMQKEAVVT